MRIDWKFNWKVTIFSVVFLLVFIYLGFWQLNRADEKVALLQAREMKANQVITDLSAVPREPAGADDTRVWLEGAYVEDAPVFLLDNRVLEGQVGYEVLVPFEVDGEETVLVNRGFVAMGRTRADVPRIPELASTGAVSGRVHVSERDTSSGNMVTPGAGDTVLLQVEDPALVVDRIDGDLYPHVVRLAEGDANALPRHWPTTVMMPSTHRGYAVQWFLMALAIAIIWSVFTWRLNHTQGDDDSRDAIDE